MEKSLEEQIKACQKCPLYQAMPLGPITGWGNKQAKIMLVGECPGEDESILEEPFVGRCGRFLDKQLIEPAGLVRSELYITNTVKCMCRVGNKNRKPKKKEILSCEDWLKEEIKLINPRVIIALGETASRKLCLNKMSFDNHVGCNFHSNGIEILPCFHPSYLMIWSRDKLDRALEVFKRAKELSDGII